MQPEDAESQDVLKVVKPLKGIESSKFQPIIRQLTNVQVAISPATLSPASKMTKKLLYSYKSCLSYGGPSAIFQQRSANRNNSVSPGGAASLYKTPTQAQEPRHRKDLSENSVVDKILDYLCKGNAREKEKLLNKILN